MDYSSYFAPPVSNYPFFALPGKPDHAYTPQDEPHTDPLAAYNDPSAFQFFDPAAPFDPNAIIHPSQSPPHSLHQPPISHSIPYDSSASISNELLPDVEFDQAPGGRGSSDDDKDNLTPAQSRRKAQNRAAQRAFRERKERHVKDLELKLKSIETRSTDLMSDNERLKRELDKLATQNEILRATSTPMQLPNPDAPQNTQATPSAPSPEGFAGGAMAYSPSSFDNAFASHQSTGPDEPISHRIHISPRTGERLLATAAAWEVILNHELYRKGLIDPGEVCERLKEKVLCDGAGPTFPESEVITAIEESVGAAGDELI